LFCTYKEINSVIIYYYIIIARIIVAYIINAWYNHYKKKIWLYLNGKLFTSVTEHKHIYHQGCNRYKVGAHSDRIAILPFL